jgi:hypothetical protein
MTGWRFAGRGCFAPARKTLRRRGEQTNTQPAQSAKHQSPSLTSPRAAIPLKQSRSARGSAACRGCIIPVHVPPHFHRRSRNPVQPHFVPKRQALPVQPLFDLMYGLQGLGVSGSLLYTISN